MREHRLIGITLEELNRQRAAVGASQVSPNPQSVNSPVAQIAGRVATAEGAIPVTELRDIRQTQTYAANNPVTITPGVNAPVGYVPPPATDGSYEQRGDSYVKLPATGNPAQPGAGGKPGALGYNPAPGGYNPAAPAESGSKPPVFTGPDAPMQSEKWEAANLEKKAAQAKYESAVKDVGQPSPQVPQTAGEPPKGGQAPTLNPAQTALIAKLRSTPGMEAYADAAEAQLMQGANAEASLRRDFSALQTNLETEKADMKKQMEDLTKYQELFSTTIQDALKQNLDDTNAQLAIQQKAADDQLVWQAQKQERILAMQKVKQHEAMIANYALFGGFGQDAAIRAVNASDNEFEGRIADLQTELGYQRTDLSVKYSGLYVETMNNYRTGLLTEMKDMRSQMTTLKLQGMTNTKEYGRAEREIIMKKSEALATLGKETSDNLLTYAKEMNSIIHNDKAEKRQNEIQAWNQIEWLKTTFGSNVPDSMVKDLAERLPGIDVKGLLALPTLAEMKAKKTGTGGGVGGISFASYQKKSDGAPPTFEDFLRHKEHEAILSGVTMFDTSPAAMANYKKEFEIRLRESERLSPANLVARVEDATKNMTEAFRVNNIKKTVDGYLQAGKLEEADRYIDGLGKTLSADERKSFQKAAGAKQNVQRVSQLIEEIGAIGPVIGRFRQLNPYDDKVVEFENIVTQTIPGLARGIFGEVGVLTDQDIATYRKTMANPTLTLDQARTATRNLLQTIELSIQNQVDLARAAGMNTRDVGLYFGVENRQIMIDPNQPGQMPSIQSSTLEASRAYAQSLLQVR